MAGNHPFTPTRYHAITLPGYALVTAVMENGINKRENKRSTEKINKAGFTQ
jgi:hypothetical protein